MPGLVKVGDSHAGHASPTPSPRHKTTYAEGSHNVNVNGSPAVRIGDKTGCGDPAADGSPNVYVNTIKVHRLNDPTGGHGSWVPNSAATSSTNVFANGQSGAQGAAATEAEGITSNGSCSNFNWNSSSCLDQSTDENAPYYTG